MPGGAYPGGSCMPGGGACMPGGMCAWGACMPEGRASHAHPLPPPVDRQTPVKT